MARAPPAVLFPLRCRIGKAPLKHLAGIEPASSAWKAEVLPLNDRCVWGDRDSNPALLLERQRSCPLDDRPWSGGKDLHLLPRFHRPMPLLTGPRTWMIVSGAESVAGFIRLPVAGARRSYQSWGRRLSVYRLGHVPLPYCRPKIHGWESNPRPRLCRPLPGHLATVK